MDTVLVIGPAGSGKSTLCGSFGNWLEGIGHRVNYINLDPGAEFLPYTPTYDVRCFVTVEELMRTKGLAPNGALVKAAGIMEASLPKILNGINSAGSDVEFNLIDTPGQMEVFIFRNLGPRLASKLRGRKVSLSLLDPGLLRSGADIVVLKLLGLIIELRLGIPSIEVLNKSDLCERGMVLRLESKITKSEYRVCGLSAELANGLNSVVRGISKSRRTISVSSTEKTGMEELYKAIGESFCACGDLS